jgi:simple sugar transport system ATP-binding protein
MVEIARAVHHNAQVIVFDEPTATLTPEEKNQFFSLVERLKLRGVSIIFISHALEEALQIADRITVMRDGQHVVTDATAAFDREKIVRAMVGRSLTGELYGSHRDRKTRQAGAKVLSVQNLSMGNVVRNTSFSVFAGQVTGVFGLIGSGRTEAAKVVTGVLKRDFFHGGQVQLNGRPVRYRVPRPAVRDGIIYVTEDRKIEGFFETMSIAENIYLGALAGGQTKAATISLREMRTIANEWIAALNVKAINADARVIELSGGNQQKVVVAKALVQKPKLVIFDEPTRGVDVGAIAEIHQLINRLADNDIAVMVISSYLPEILQISDRILVCRQGRIVEEFEGRGADEETIMYAAVH